jgi:hypothetical protein
LHRLRRIRDKRGRAALGHAAPLVVYILTEYYKYVESHPASQPSQPAQPASQPSAQIISNLTSARSQPRFRTRPIGKVGRRSGGVDTIAGP